MIAKFSDRINALGLFIDRDIKKDQTIFVLHGNILNKPNKYSIEVGKNKHIVDRWGRYLNHSFYPNTKIEKDKVVAIQDISKGEKMHFNYNENETKNSCPFITSLGPVTGKKKYYYKVKANLRYFKK